MNPEARIGLIIPSSNRLTEPQFQRHAPPGVAVHVTRLRMTGRWHRPLQELQQAIAEAAAALSDVRPGIIVFHCTASSMEEGPTGAARVIEIVENASGCPAITTGQAITHALKHLGVKRLVLISPYVEKTHQREVRYLRAAGFEVVHGLGLGLSGSEEYTAVTPERWLEIAGENSRAEAEGYLLSCTNTRGIEVIEALERSLKRPVVTSNQAVLWACLKQLHLIQPIAGLGRLFNRA